MAKHAEIIKNLSEEQTAELAKNAACLAREEYKAAGIPQVRFAYAEKVNGGRYPSYKAMANCWDKDLMQKVWRDAALFASAEAEVFVSPYAGVCNSPYSSGAAEDPYLAGAYISALTEGVKQAGLIPCVACGVEKTDVAFMDVLPDERAFCEYYMRPYTYAAEGSAFCLPYAEYGGAYGDIYIKQNEFLHKFCGSGAVFCGDVPENLTAKCVTAGNFITSRKADAVKNEEKLTEAVATASVGRTIDFAYNAQKQKSLADKGEFSRDGLPLAAAEQSCVLLKNDKILPVRKGGVAVMGGISADVKARPLAELFKTGGYPFAEWCEGYSFDDDVTPNLAEEGAALAQKAQYCILFLGFDEKSGVESRLNRHTKLPANQLALIDKISSTDKKIIAVVGADYPVDLSFADKVAAILLCPSTGKSTVQAVYNIITGKVSPSGRLARTWYADADERFKLIKNECRAGSRKIGVFAGYRGYVSGEKAAYPFGYGLSYSSFKYSDLNIEGNLIKFRVKNMGAAAAEVVQVYIGHTQSTIVRPEMELKAFIRVSLQAGESAMLSVKIGVKAFEAYSGGKFVTEGGKYAVYIGGSPQDIKLKGYIEIPGARLKTDGEKRCFYNTYGSNVIAGGYTLKPVSVKPPKNNWRLTAGFALATLAVLLAAAAFIAYLGGYADFEVMDETATLAVRVTGGVAALAILFIFAGLIKNMKSNQKGTQNSGKVKISRVDSAEQQSFEKLFSELYGSDDEDYLPEIKGKEKPEETAKNKEKASVEAFVGKFDKSLTFNDFCGQMDEYLSGCGLALGIGGVRKTLAAMAASKVVLLEGNSPLNWQFTAALCKYFTGDVYRFATSEVYAGIDNARNPFGIVLKNARSNPENLYMAVIWGADPDGDAKLISALTHCAYATEEVVLSVGGSEFVAPPNLWYVFVNGGGLNYKQTDFCNAAAVLALDLAACDKDEKTVKTPFTYYQFMGMLDRLIRFEESEKYVLNEEICWKRIDKLERYLNGKCGYELDNRDCLSIERYSAVYLACGGEQSDALDCVAASKLALPLMVMLADAELEDGEINSRIDSIFDESGEIKRVISSYYFIGE